MITEKSDRLYETASKLMPGGVNSPVRAFRNVGRNPLFISSGKGEMIYDADGNGYIDYVCSWGPLILGHAHEKVVDEVRKAAGLGLTFGAPTQRESRLAELIMTVMPCVERLRLVNSGTEAVMSALRVARGYTGRNLIVKFEGCYHGHSDGLLVKAGSGLLTCGTPDSAGIPEGYTNNTLVAEYNSLDSVEKLFDAYDGKIAAVIVEPVAANMGVVPPKEGFLEGLRAITEKNGALLIFDEVITGFRLAPGGASQYYGVRPDLVTLGKITGGGMPLAAYGGKKEIMALIAPEGPVYQAGTLSGNPVATAAGCATLEILLDNQFIYEDIERKAGLLEGAFRKKGLTVNRVGSLMSAFFTSGEVETYEDVLQCDFERFSRYFSLMLENGIYVAPSQFEALFISAAHTEESIKRTADVIDMLNI